MAKQPSNKKDREETAQNGGLNSDSEITEDFVQDLIKDLNKEHQSRIAWNLSTDTTPTHVKRWISTGSRLLDYSVSNRRNGGLPEGRIIEIFGAPSIGKSHIATQIARSTQKLGGVVVYIDTENATNPENLKALGIDVSKRFIYSDPACTEDVFTVIESVINKVKASQKDIPVTIIWDSLAATSPKAELLADYDKDSIGLQARALSKGFRKITQVIGHNNILLVVLNQTRTKIGLMFGDPTTTPGGSAVPFHASVRIQLFGGQKIGEKDDTLGINVMAKTIKNKVSPPFRSVNFQIHFGVGIVEHEEIFDIIRTYCEEHGPLDKGDARYVIEGTGAWKTLRVTSIKDGTVELEKKFTKSAFNEIIDDPQYTDIVEDLLEYAMIKKPDTQKVQKSTQETEAQ